MDSGRQKVYISKIFMSVFFAGIASLQMELSVLREATFIFGSTAFTNSFIISVFLAGLAIGSYGGNLLVRLCKGKATEIFLISQAAHIVVILFFVYTKSYILYGSFSKLLNITYFGFVTVVPSIVGGMAFALFLHMLYDTGEKHIALVYAISTAGNVFSGILHGLVLVPYFGMMSTYLVAIINTGLAMLLILRFQIVQSLSLAFIVAVAGFSAMAFKFVPEAIKESVLWGKDDIYGFVEIRDISHLRNGYRGGKGIDLLVHNRHNCSNSEIDVNWHKNSAILSMEFLDNHAKKALLLGYCSGATVSQLLDFESITKIVSIEMNKSVLEASEIFFPVINAKNSKDERSEIVLDEFRSYLKRQPHHVKFDVVILDISILDPYFFGMFTREFFVEIYKHLNKPGVVFFHYPSLMRTAADVFDHIYQLTDKAFDHIYQPVNKLHISKKWYFCTNFGIREEKKHFFSEVFPKKSPGKVYADNKVYRYPPLPLMTRILEKIREIVR